MKEIIQYNCFGKFPPPPKKEGKIFLHISLVDFCVLGILQTLAHYILYFSYHLVERKMTGLHS